MPLPEFSIVLERGKTFTPPPENYILQADENARCLGLRPITGPLPIIIGNLLQKKFFIHSIQCTTSLLGFAHADCSVHN